jgi:hypothetical protein
MYERYLMAVTALYLGPRASEITKRQVRDIDDDCTLYVIPPARRRAAGGPSASPTSCGRSSAN